MKNTKSYITAIKKILPEINSVAEVQCGDAYDIENCQALQDKALQYIGLDVRDEIIFDNRQYFRDEKQKIFMTLDASNEPLPRADLIIALNMASHLPIANIWSLLENIRDSEAKYFLFNYDVEEEGVNEDFKIDENLPKSKSRPINLTKAPFYFPSADFLLPLEEKNRFAAFYKISDISFFMDWHNDDVSKLRADLFYKLNSDFATLKSAFSKQENGDEMFKEMMVGFLEMEAGAHNQKFYYDEPYRAIIDKNQVLNYRNNIFRLVYKSELEAIASEYDFLNEENFLWAQVLTKDFIRFYCNLSIWLD